MAPDGCPSGLWVDLRHTTGISQRTAALRRPLAGAASVHDVGRVLHLVQHVGDVVQHEVAGARVHVQHVLAKAGLFGKIIIHS